METRVFLKYFVRVVDLGEYTAGVFVDLKKTFDTMDHNILINKLEHYGVSGVTKEWFCSYLKNRKQFVSIDDLSLTLHIFLLESQKGQYLGR